MQRILYRVRHIKCYRAIALKLLITSKNVSDKSFSVREGRHTRPPYFLIGGGTGATSWSNPLFKMEPCILFSMALLPILIITTNFSLFSLQCYFQIFTLSVIQSKLRIVFFLTPCKKGGKQTTISNLQNMQLKK